MEHESKMIVENHVTHRGMLDRLKPKEPQAVVYDHGRHELSTASEALLKNGQS